MMSSRLGLVAEVMPTESPSQLSPVVIQITWAVISSVSCCLGANSTGHRPLLSTDPRQRVADQLVHDPPAAEARLHQHHPGRLGPHLADLRRLLAALAPRAARRAPRRPPPAPRRRRACPRSPRTSGRSPGSPPRPRRPGRPAPRPRARSSPRREARASSLSTEATPPRVASRMQRSPGPAASSSASTTGHSERVSDSTVRLELELAAGEHDRGAVLADRAREQDPVAGAQALRAQASRAGRGAPTPVVARYIRSAWPRSTTLVSPATISTPARARRCARSPRPPRAARRSRGPPRGSSRASARAGGRPPTARSLTVPLTASSPIEPPGKRSGLTTKESVVITTSPAAPASAMRRVASPKAGTNRPSISVCVALPPAPWAIVIAASLKRGRLRARGLDDPEDPLLPADARSDDLLLPREAPVVVVGGAGALGADTMQVPIACSGVQAVPNTLHSHGLMTPLSTSPHWHALGSATRTPGTEKRRSASKSA